MKKHLLLSFFSILLSVVGYGQTLDLPVDFENTTPDFYGLTDFGGNTSTIVADPLDANNHVAQSIKGVGAETWAGTTLGGTVGFASNVPFASGSTRMSVRVYSPAAGIHVRLKVEAANDPTISVETEAITTVANAWETLVFDFSNQAAGTAAINYANSYNKASIFFDFGNAGTGATYYWDDMQFIGGSSTQTEPTEAAPTPTTDPLKVISIFSDAYTNVSGTNFNPSWGQTTATSQVSIAGNNTLKMEGLDYQGIELGSSQNVSAMSYLHLDYWTANSTALNVYLISPGPIEEAYALAVPTTGWNSVDIPLTAFSNVDLSNVFQFKFDGNGTIFIDNIYFYAEGVPAENDATLSDLKVDGTTVTGFSPSILNYKVNLAPGITTVPTVTATSNISGANVAITPATAIPGTTTIVVTATDGVTAKTYSVAFAYALNLPVTFEETTLDYGLTDFGGNTSSIVVDPVDATNHVAQSIKGAGAETWAGTTVGGTVGFADKIPFEAGSTKMSVRVYSPSAGIHVRLKVEAASDPTISVETEAITTMANTWETLVFDFSNQAAGTAAINFANSYNKASIFFDFGNAGTGATYYWDDMAFGVTTGIENPSFTGNSVCIYPNPVQNELNIRSNSPIKSVYIYNIVGAKVKEYGNVSDVNVSDLNAGLYIIKLTDTAGKTVSLKFNKE